MTNEMDVIVDEKPLVNPSKLAGSVKLPIATVNKSSLYNNRTKSDKNGASEVFVNSSESKDRILHRSLRETKSETSTFDNLSPNVRRMISSATETTALKFQKKTVGGGKSSTRYKSNIPLVGATSKISQSGVEILPSVEIYDQPCDIRSQNKVKLDKQSPTKIPGLKPKFKVDEETCYDVPTNNCPIIYDVPVVASKTAFESLSLPYIDQSIELSISSNDREFDIKLSSKENSPQKPEPKSLTPEASPAKFPKTLNGTNSLCRKDFTRTESPAKQLSKSGPYPEVVGSTGNLKTFVNPEKDLKLNPPAAEVPRPLSMSSIASSSSTSSSGVQNKGGVNSAYLASIESLDDHSDADMISANGSNNFVNNAGILNTSVSEEGNSETIPRQQGEAPGLSQLERVCAEIVQTENVYVEDLRQVVEGYLHVWRRESTFSDEELTELFNNIEDIYAFNRSLCEELNTCRLDATCIARCFVNNTTGFSVYTSYCTGYPRTMKRLAALASDPDSAREFREKQLALCHPLPLASYLLKPVQRILKYHLLLQNVVKQCASRETEYALLKMTGIAQHIDDMKRRHEHAVRVQEIQSLLYGWNGPDLTTYGELCAEGTFRVFGAKAMRHAFLFDKMLLVTKNREDGILAYKTHIMCNNMMLVESIAGAPLSFHVIPWDAPRSQLTLQARSARHKREWTLLIKRVILENYQAVIPSHARQLVMELGQNKTDDDMLAEKSHNLITQASMRKQLSAPEYLEKRKLDRERRKSFENGIRGRLKKVNRKYTVPNSRSEISQDCDCAQFSAEKGIDYTCENCYVDLCSDCEAETAKDKVKKEGCSCRGDNEISGEKCPECDRLLHYIDSGSAEHLERKLSSCKCSDFKSSEESFGKEFTNSLTKTRGYHSSDNIVGYTEGPKGTDDLTDNNSLTNIRNIPKTCLKCAKIKENIVVTDSTNTLHSRKSRCNEGDKHKEMTRSKSRDDPQRSKLSKIGTWRRKSEPGLPQNTGASKKSLDSDSERNDGRGCEKIEFECRNCGSNKISKKNRSSDGVQITDSELDNTKKPNLEIRMYNTKNVPKKISKLKKNRAKGLRLGSDTTAKFYADFSTDVSTENILHISESNDSLNIDKPNDVTKRLEVPATISKDEDIDEETYKRLIEKTDSFKKNELEKGKYMNKQKVINEGSETEEKTNEGELNEEIHEDEAEKPLEQIISQLLLQNREFQRLLKKQQLRNTAQRRHQRLLKSHSNPEQAILQKNGESLKLKPKYGRQTSENIDCDQSCDVDCTNTTESLTMVEPEQLDDDHIYETLRCDGKETENLHTLNNKSKLIQHHHTHLARPRRLPSPPNKDQIFAETRTPGPDSDYVYLSFDQINRNRDAESIYDVPISPEKPAKLNKCDNYEHMENKGPPKTEKDNMYDTLLELRRNKDESDTLASEYLPMTASQQSPNTPEIWLSRQKEHFTVSRDRKSGSLPRSFQVITTNQEDNNLSSFKCKPNSNSKTYLNRDGKVMSTDRPFTIASDKSEISYDDVENYMSEGDILKFKRDSKNSDNEYAKNVSQSTLELEEEIDRCYKNNFEKINLDKNKNENLLTVSQPNLNISTTSSCEILPTDQNEDNPPDIEIFHPEHKIYKPTGNILSLKNVLSRFKGRNKNNDDTENANDQSSPDSGKSDVKSPSNEKKSALNPKNYSKNLLQRFRSIIGDEHSDDNKNEIKPSCVPEDSQNIPLKSEIKVVITSTEGSPTTSTYVNLINSELLSKSVFEQTTLTDSQHEKNNLDALSYSCDNINEKDGKSRVIYEKSISLTSNVSSTSSPSKSNNSSYQSLNKLPIYMQGSKHLGARIAQSDYLDPTTLLKEKSTLQNVNVLINKNAVRPDSLFSNSSFVTSSSEGTYLENQSKSYRNDYEESAITNTNSDESFYEKSFEKIEQVTDEDVFRDSAVYSDQEESEEMRTESSGEKTVNKSISRVDSTKRSSSFKSQNVSTTISFSQSTSLHTRVLVKTSKTNFMNNTAAELNAEKVKSKVAPPVPVKPKITNIPSSASFQAKTYVLNKNNLNKADVKPESVNVKTIKKNVNHKQPLMKSESVKEKPVISETNDTKIAAAEDGNETEKIKAGSIHLKRMGFERASLDSATRKIKTTNEIKRSSIEQPKVMTKSVLERRMEIEQMSKSHIVKPSVSIKKPTPIARQKSITTKVATFERNVNENAMKDVKNTTSCAVDKDNIPAKNVNEIVENETDPKGSWVKQVVHKFQ
ncbi:putative uncharacterized protein DDB_G0282133 isoform X2 [Amyelois transitella]|nr:putative uncharacterized protein DDB_G0282133 isoform X2 [Amyelois transitella]